jgi:hypothetical protein
MDCKIRKLAVVSPLLEVEKIKGNNKSGIGQQNYLLMQNLLTRVLMEHLCL